MIRDLLVMFCLCLAVAATAAEQADADPNLLAQRLGVEFKAGKYADAERTCDQLIALQPKESGHAYNLACAQARQGRTEPALRSLSHAVELGFADADHALADDDLAAVRTLSEFERLLAVMREKPYADGSPYEAGDEIAGMTTIERAPAGGLRYRLRVGGGVTADHPARLVVWLHPSGGSGDRGVESLAPAFAAHGYALAVFSQKQYGGWTQPEIERIPMSIADMAKQPGIDACAPILMGFSAGGQAALMLWQKMPEAFGGLMTCAAYPIDVARQVPGARGMAMMQPPAGALASKTPILALVGGDDRGGVAAWQQAEPAWTKAGVPLTLRVAPGRGHEFLFRDADWDATLAWLDERRGATSIRPSKPANSDLP